MHDDPLLRLVDGWIGGLTDQAFTDVLPLLRRTFAEYAAPERRTLGERVRHLDGSAGRTRTGEAEALDEYRAAQAAETVLTILGWRSTTPS